MNFEIKDHFILLYLIQFLISAGYNTRQTQSY